MSPADWVRSLTDCRLEPGLSPAELDAAQAQFGVRFAPLWTQVLREAHPVALPVPERDPDGVRRWTPYPDWRGRDIPGTTALVDAARRPGVAPLTPLRGHWYAGWLDGHPVLSIVGTDVWVVAETLADLLHAPAVPPLALPPWIGR